jgi:hypothetical protein
MVLADADERRIGIEPGDGWIPNPASAGMVRRAGAGYGARMEKVCSTGSAVWRRGGVLRPHCQATTVTLIG